MPENSHIFENAENIRDQLKFLPIEIQAKIFEHFPELRPPIRDVPEGIYEEVEKLRYHLNFTNNNDEVTILNKLISELGSRSEFLENHNEEFEDSRREILEEDLINLTINDA